MGQRHQAFVIARITPHGATQAKYRCIGALHHQWCYGRLPLRATRRFITLIKQKDNAEIIREEISGVQGLYGRWTQSPNLPSVPCPFLNFILASAWTTELQDAEDVYVSGCSMLPADMGSSEGDNNDGITVIDVTEPQNPSYCFVSATGLESEQPVPQRVPLSASDYARAYYPLPSNDDLRDERNRRMENDVQAKINSLDDVPLVTLDMLAEAWPAEYAKSSQNEQSVDNLARSTRNDSTIPTLADLSLKPAIDHALLTSDVEGIEAIMRIVPSKANSIKEALRVQNPFPDIGVPLLAEVIGQELGTDKALDLSHFSLSSDQIITVTSKYNDLKILKLSHNPHVTADTVRKILKLHSTLHRLLILGTSVSDEELNDLLATEPELFVNVDSLIHPLLLKWKASYPSSFAILNVLSYNSINGAMIPFLNPPQVIQCLTDHLSLFSHSISSIYEVKTPFLPQVIFSSAQRKPGQKWGERTFNFIPQFSPPLFRQGWIFAFQWPERTDEKNMYGFINLKDLVAKASAEEVTLKDGASPKVYGLLEFCKEMDREGRPPASVDAIQGLMKILEKLKSTQGLNLMTDEDVVPYIQKVIRLYQRNIYLFGGDFD